MFQAGAAEAEQHALATHHCHADFTCVLMRASQSSIPWQEQICHPNIDAISAEMNALGLIPTCNLSQKHDMTEETEQLCPTTADGVGRSSCRAPLESDSCPLGSDVSVAERPFSIVYISEKKPHSNNIVKPPNRIFFG